MNAEEDAQHGNDRFGEGTAFHGERETGNAIAWSHIAQHLESAELVAVPPHFRREVVRRLAHEKLRRDIFFALPAAIVTSAILICLTALVLGLKWWSLATFYVVESGSAFNLLRSLVGRVAYAFDLVAILVASTRSFWSVVPQALLVVALLAAFAEFAAFRLLLRAGRLAARPSFHPTTTRHAL